MYLAIYPAAIVLICTPPSHRIKLSPSYCVASVHASPTSPYEPFTTPSRLPARMAMSITARTGYSLSHTCSLLSGRGCNSFPSCFYHLTIILDSRASVCCMQYPASLAFRIICSCCARSACTWGPRSVLSSAHVTVQMRRALVKQQWRWLLASDVTLVCHTSYAWIDASPLKTPAPSCIAMHRWRHPHPPHARVADSGEMSCSDHIRKSGRRRNNSGRTSPASVKRVRQTTGRGCAGIRRREAAPAFARMGASGGVDGLARPSACFRSTTMVLVSLRCPADHRVYIHERHVCTVPPTHPAV